MKKVILTAILFISSFFLFNLNVNAAIYNYNIKEEDMALINDNFFDFRNQVLDFVGESKVYLIYYHSGEYRAIIADNDSPYSLKFNGFNGNSWFIANNFDIYVYKSKKLTFNSSITSSTNIIAVDNSLTPGYFFLDGNISNLTSSTGSNYFYVVYNGSSYGLPWKSASLYNIYLKNFAPPEEPEPEDPYAEEKTLLSSFYTISIEKISYLTNAFVTNYIFLTILGVFFLIYVIELFRRLLR